MTFDNLGGNVALGFVQSFSATFFCRMCMCSKAETKKLSTALPEKYRTLSNYQEAIQIIKNSSEVDFKKTKGIAEYCVLNDLENFHILTNWTADIMHDLCEGTIKVLLIIFFEIGMKHKIFSENDIKNLISNYHGYGVLNSQFIPSAVKLTTKNLNQSASQMKCLFQHLPFIFYSYKDHPKLETAWICVSTLLTILMICYSNTISEPNLIQLDLAVKSHLENIQRLGIELKPKHHFMVHYSEIIRRSGPLCHMSTLRYEMKHKSLTSIMRNSNNFKCVTKSMTEKYLHKNVFQNVYTNQIKHTKLRKIEQNSLLRYKQFLDIFENPSSIQTTKNFKLNSDFYEKGSMLKYDEDYLEIENILYIEKSFYFVCRKYQRIRFVEFLVSLEIKPSIPEEYLLVKHSDLIYKKSHDKKLIGDQHIFILCDSLDVQ